MKASPLCGNYIKKIRHHHGLSLRDLGGITGFTYSYLAKVESNKAKACKSTASYILSTLGVHFYHHSSFLRGVIEPEFKVLNNGNIKEPGGRIRTVGGKIILNNSRLIFIHGDLEGCFVIHCPLEVSSLIFYPPNKKQFPFLLGFEEIRNVRFEAFVKEHGCGEKEVIPEGSTVNVHGRLSLD